MSGAVALNRRPLRGRLNWRRLAASGPFVSAVVFVILYFFWFWYSPGGLQTTDVNNFLTLTTTLALAGFGTTLVVVAGGFDLSIAGVISVVNALLAAQLTNGGNVILTLIICLLVGLGTGMLNGFLVAVIKLESIAATLATYILLSGVALLILSQPGGTVPSSLSNPLTAIVGGIPVALFILLALAAAWMILRRTRFGVGVFALGESEEAARMSGVRTRVVKFGAFAIAGVMYALGGIYLSAVTVTGDPASGQPFLLQAFAAVALGGASLSGGRGSAIGTIMGALVLTLIPKVLFVLGASDFWAGLIQGVVVIVAVVFGLASARLSRRSAVTPAQPTMTSAGPTGDAA